MKHLYESILDDEDDILNNDTVIVKSAKEDIIKFIKLNYHLRNHRGTLLNITRYIRINKDFTVDIKVKPGQYPELYPSYGAQGMPTNGLFKWGKVWNIETSCKGLKKFENFPVECNRIRITTAEEITDLSGLPQIVNSLNIYYLNSIKDLKTLPKNIKIESLLIYTANNLVSLAGCPDIKYDIDLHHCMNLEKIPNDIHSESFRIFGNPPKLTDKEKQKIKSKFITIR